MYELLYACWQAHGRDEFIGRVGGGRAVFGYLVLGWRCPPLCLRLRGRPDAGCCGVGGESSCSEFADGVLGGGGVGRHVHLQ